VSSLLQCVVARLTTSCRRPSSASRWFCPADPLAWVVHPRSRGQRGVKTEGDPPRSGGAALNADRPNSPVPPGGLSTLPSDPAPWQLTQKRKFQNNPLAWSRQRCQNRDMDLPMSGSVDRTPGSGSAGRRAGVRSGSGASTMAVVAIRSLPVIRVWWALRPAGPACTLIRHDRLAALHGIASRRRIPWSHSVREGICYDGSAAR